MSAEKRTGLAARIFSQDYCCFFGYLGLCRARGETVPDMAKNIGVHRFTIYFHYRKLARGEHKCERQTSCLKDVIKEISS